jgi:AcrR family transcriptional regulator
VLEVARARFTERGYAGTTMGDIAAEAGVSIKTVEAAFGTKSNVLKVLVDIAIAGDDEPVALLDRPIMEQLRDEPEVTRAVELYAGLVTSISSRLAGVASVVEQAAGVHAEMGELWTTMNDNRMYGARRIATLLQSKAPFRPEVDADRAADVLYLFNDPAVYRTLVSQRGWTGEEFQAWLAGTYHDQLW